MFLFLVTNFINQLCMDFRLAVTLPASSHSVCARVCVVYSETSLRVKLLSLDQLSETLKIEF